MRVAPTTPIAIAAVDSVCQNQTTLLQATPGYARYEWNTGNAADTLATLTAGPGRYIVTGTSAQGCNASDTVTIQAKLLPLVAVLGDTSLCPGGTGTVRASGAFAHYRWVGQGIGDTLPTLSISSGGRYTLEVRNASGCVGRGSRTVVQRLPRNLTLAGPEKICPDSLVLVRAEPDQPTADSVRYAWTIFADNGSVIMSPTTLSQLQLTLPGRIRLKTVDKYGCTDTASVVVRPAVLGRRSSRDTAVCAGQVWVAHLPAGPRYTWFNANGTSLGTGNPFNLNNAGVYVARSDIGCEATEDTFRLTYRSVPINPPKLTGLADTLCVEDEQIVVTIDSASGRSILASTVLGQGVVIEGFTHIHLTLKHDGMDTLYLRTQAENACPGVFAYPFLVEKCGYGLFVPNAFTPGEGTLNESWAIRGLNVTEVQIEVYNRWGQLLYKTQDWNVANQSLRAPWPGDFKGKACPSGSYQYHIRYKVLIDSAAVSKTKTGTVLIIR